MANNEKVSNEKIPVKEICGKIETLTQTIVCFFTLNQLADFIS